MKNTIRFQLTSLLAGAAFAGGFIGHAVMQVWPKAIKYILLAVMLITFISTAACSTSEIRDAGAGAVNTVLFTSTNVERQIDSFVDPDKSDNVLSH